MADKSKKSDEDILALARKRLDTAIAAFADSRTNELEDLRFAAGSPDNNWQWDTYAQSTRGEQDSRPCLTINKIPQHIKQVTNDQRQNQPTGKVIPANGDADVAMAEIFEGVVRFIEYNSDADIVYDTACENQVTFGEGYWRILTDYENEDSFDQDIFLVRIENSFSVYMDPMIKKPNGGDQKWCFIADEIEHDEYEDLFPDAATISSLQEMGVGDGSMSAWVNEKTIRIVEYFYFETTKATLNLYKDNNTSFDDEPKDKVHRKMLGNPTKSHTRDRKQVKWIKTNGYEILDSRDWPGKYIPVIRVPGNEFLIDGQKYLSGIVRNAKDPQRRINYWASQEAEMLALAPKSPFIGAAGQFDGFEGDWTTANTKNHPYLQYNPIVDDASGQMHPPPQRVQAPMVQSGLIEARKGADQDLKEVTGQYNASLGQQGNERSGKAINARQHESDVSTYHYISNLSRAVRESTRILIDLIPKIYDRPGRIAQIIGEDGSHKTVKIDPTMPNAITKEVDQQGNEIGKIYNPGIGKYNVRVTTGPSYTTKRTEALDAMVQLLQGNAQLWAVIGDLVVKNMDWPGAQELSKRLMKSMDPKLFVDDDDPALKQLQQQIQQLTQQLDQCHQMLAGAHNSIEAREVAVKETKAKIDAFDAETRRIAATAQAARAATQDQAIQTPEQIQEVVAGILHSAIDSGHIQGALPDGVMPPQQPDPNAPPPAPPLDPNKQMVENSKHVLQVNQQDHEARMAQMQHAHEADMQANAPQPVLGGPQ